MLDYQRLCRLKALYPGPMIPWTPTALHWTESVWTTLVWCRCSSELSRTLKLQVPSDVLYDKDVNGVVIVFVFLLTGATLLILGFENMATKMLLFMLLVVRTLAKVSLEMSTCVCILSVDAVIPPLDGSR
jgi:hypothetical protein